MTGIWSWIRRGIWSIADQGIFALSNFGINLFLARWLVAEEYGIFTLAFSVFFFVGTIHTSLVTEPMLVYGPRKGDALRQYLSELFTAQWFLSAQLTLSIAGLAVILLLKGSTAAASLITLSIASPFILFQWAVRKSCYVSGSPRHAVKGGVFYLLILAILAICLHTYGKLGAPSAIIIIAISSILSGLMIARMQGIVQFLQRPKFITGIQATLLPGLSNAERKEHWQYGKWAVWAALASWVPWNLFYLLLPIASGYSGVADFRAAMNLVLPVLQINTALAIAILPTMVISLQAGTHMRTLWKAMSIIVSLTVVYGFAVIYFRVAIIEILYGGAYPHIGQLVVLLTGACIFSAVITVTGAAIRATVRTRVLLSAYGSGAVVALTLGSICVLNYGPVGAAWGLLVSLAVIASVLGYYSCRVHSEHEVAST